MNRMPQVQQINTQYQAKKPDAYLNLKLVTKGGEISLGKGIQLFADTKLGRSLLAAAENDPDREYEVVGTVFVINEDDDTKYEL